MGRELPSFCTSEWPRAFNSVISFYFHVSLEEIKETAALNVELNCVVAAKIFVKQVKIAR
jgi:hypothetical protein